MTQLCKNCRYYDEILLSKGICLHPKMNVDYDKMPINGTGIDCCSFCVGENFGCIHWEEQKDDTMDT